MILVLAFAAFTLVLPEPSLDSGDGMGLVLNEFMARPASAHSEAEGEWIELYNSSSDWINLGGMRIMNQNGQTIYLSSYLLPPESYYVLGACGDENRNGGYTPDFVYQSFRIEDDDRLILENSSGTEVDMVDFDASWPIYFGSSCERINPGWVSNMSSTWAEAQESYGEGDLGTPGHRNSVFQNSFAENSWAFIKAFVQ